MAEHATGLGDIVTKDKIKLPAWAWWLGSGIVVIGGVAYWWYRRKTTAAAAAAAAQQAQQTSTTPAGATYANPTTILPIFQGGGGGATPAAGVAPIYPPGRTTGFWYTTPVNAYPQEVFQHATGLPDYNSPNAGRGPDYVSLSVGSVWLALANPGVGTLPSGQYPAGTRLFIPAQANNGWGPPSAWDGVWPTDNAGQPTYVPLPTTTGSTPTTSSGA